MAGVPADIRVHAARSAKCQQAALMWIANVDLEHEDFTWRDWKCETAAGKEAAGNSNIGAGAAQAAGALLFLCPSGGEASGPPRRR